MHRMRSSIGVKTLSGDASPARSRTSGRSHDHIWAEEQVKLKKPRNDSDRGRVRSVHHFECSGDHIPTVAVDRRRSRTVLAETGSGGSAGRRCYSRDGRYGPGDGQYRPDHCDSALAIGKLAIPTGMRLDDAQFAAWKTDLAHHTRHRPSPEVPVADQEPM